MREVQNAIIESATITQSERDFLTFYITVKLQNGFNQSFGGHSLFLRDRKSDHFNKKTFTGYYISECLDVAGVGEWDQLIGKTIRVDGDNIGIYGIGHIINDKWFYPEKLWGEEND